MPLLPPLPAPVLSSRNAADNLLYHRDLDAGPFPPGNSGGPIEAITRGNNRSVRWICFRRVIPAAPLKPMMSSCCHVFASLFPPGNSGGPIEARSFQSISFLSPCAFPAG